MPLTILAWFLLYLMSHINYIGMVIVISDVSHVTCCLRFEFIARALRLTCTSLSVWASWTELCIWEWRIGGASALCTSFVFGVGGCMLATLNKGRGHLNWFSAWIRQFYHTYCICQVLMFTLTSLNISAVNHTVFIARTSCLYTKIPFYLLHPCCRNLIRYTMTRQF